jgi:acylphosphatase
VQGVFFRDTARRMADARQVRGWITNRDDGAVEAVFEGGRDAVEEMIAFAREGPRGAVVEEVELSEEEPEGLSSFRVS